LAHLACRHGEYDASLEALEELLTAQRSAGDRLGAAYTPIHIGNAHFSRGAYAAAWDCLERSRVEAADLADQDFESYWNHYGGMLAVCEGRYELAHALASTALNLFRAADRRVWGAYCQVTLGTVDREEGRYEDARSRFNDVLKVALESATGRYSPMHRGFLRARQRTETARAGGSRGRRGCGDTHT
jgi:tetratricopeptide (TPR) repeat protein